MPHLLRRCIAVTVASSVLLLGVVVAPSTSSAATGGNCGGTPIVKGFLTLWKCTFDDEFSGTTLDTSKWTVQQTASSGFKAGPACFVNSPNNVSVASGYLKLTVRKEAAPFVCKSPGTTSFATQYTSGMVMTYNHFAQAYGRFEVRAAFPASTIAGLQEALWMAPKDIAHYGLWPASGEIDIAEVYSLTPNRAIPYVHYVSAVPDYHVTNNNCTIKNISALHTYVVEWTASAITVKYDGVTCISDAWNPAKPLHKPQPFDQPFVVALTQGLGVAPNTFNPSTTQLPASTYIDYVRAWS